MDISVRFILELERESLFVDLVAIHSEPQGGSDDALAKTPRSTDVDVSVSDVGHQPY
jgi:hypothetical protein